MLTIVVGRGEGENRIRRGTGRTREDSKGRERRGVERTRRRCWIDRQWHRRRAQEGNSAAKTSVSNCERPFLSTSWCLAGSASLPSLPHPDSCRLAANGHCVSQPALHTDGNASPTPEPSYPCRDFDSYIEPKAVRISAGASFCHSIDSRGSQPPGERTWITD